MDLISPLTFPEEKKQKPDTHDPGFDVSFVCPEFPAEVEPLDHAFFANSWAKLSARVDSNGLASYDIETTKKTKYQIEKHLSRESNFNHLKDSVLEIYIFTYKPEYFSRSEWKMSQTQQIGDEQGGVKVYADNFRVFGYGAKGDDWLATSYDRARSVINLGEEVNPYADDGIRAGLSLFRDNNLFGHVMFARASNPSLEITVNRERIISSEAFEELRYFVRLGVDFATVLYANQVAREQAEDAQRLESMSLSHKVSLIL